MNCADLRAYGRALRRTPHASPVPASHKREAPAGLSYQPDPREPGPTDDANHLQRTERPSAVAAHRIGPVPVQPQRHRSNGVPLSPGRARYRLDLDLAVHAAAARRAMRCPNASVAMRVPVIGDAIGNL